MRPFSFAEITSLVFIVAVPAFATHVEPCRAPNPTTLIRPMESKAKSKQIPAGLAKKAIDRFSNIPSNLPKAQARIRMQSAVSELSTAWRAEPGPSKKAPRDKGKWLKILEKYPEYAPCIPYEGEFEGTINLATVIYPPDWDDSEPWYHYEAELESGRVVQINVEDPNSLVFPTGTKVKMRGQSLPHDILVDTIEVLSMPPVSSVPHTGVIPAFRAIVGFPGSPTPTHSFAELQTVSANIRVRLAANSHGRLDQVDSFLNNGNVIPVTSSEFRIAVKQVLDDEYARGRRTWPSGALLSLYGDNTAVSYRGIASLGPVSVTMPGGEVWTLRQNHTITNMALAQVEGTGTHEDEHTFGVEGLHHDSYARDCESGVIFFGSPSLDCHWRQEYGGLSGCLGNSGTCGALPTFQQRQVGWIDDEDLHIVDVGHPGGTFTVGGRVGNTPFRRAVWITDRVGPVALECVTADFPDTGLTNSNAGWLQRGLMWVLHPYITASKPYQIDAAQSLKSLGTWDTLLPVGSELPDFANGRVYKLIDRTASSCTWFVSATGVGPTIPPPTTTSTTTPTTTTSTTLMGQTTTICNAPGSAITSQTINVDCSASVLGTGGTTFTKISIVCGNGDSGWRPLPCSTCSNPLNMICTYPLSGSYDIVTRTDSDSPVAGGEGIPWVHRIVVISNTTSTTSTSTSLPTSTSSSSTSSTSTSVSTTSTFITSTTLSSECLRCIQRKCRNACSVF